MIYLTTPGPHLSSKDSVRKMFWTLFAGLFLIWLSAFVRRPLETFAATGAVLAGLAAAEAVFFFLENKRPDFANGSAFSAALVLTLLLPASLGPGPVLGASFFAFSSRRIFGGLGANPFHPALAGAVFSGLFLPFHAAHAVPVGGFSGFVFFAALAAGIILVLAGRAADWEIAFLFLLPLVPALFILRAPGMFETGLFVFLAFFVVPDPATTPASAQGKRLFSLLSGLLTVIFMAALGGTPRADVFASGLLFMNAASLWVERLVWRRSGGIG